MNLVYDPTAAEAKAEAHLQDQYDIALGGLLTNFKTKIEEITNKSGMPPLQLIELLTQLDNSLNSMLSAVATGQAASLPQPTAPSGASALGAPSSPTTPAADPKLQQELTDLRSKAKTQTDVLNDIAATCGTTITGGDYSKLATAVKDYGTNEAKKAEAKKADDFKDVLPKADGQAAANDILYWINQGKKGFGGAVKLSEEDFDNLKARVEQLKNDTK